MSRPTMVVFGEPGAMVFEQWERIDGKHRLTRRWYINDHGLEVELPLPAPSPPQPTEPQKP